MSQLEKYLWGTLQMCSDLLLLKAPYENALACLNQKCKDIGPASGFRYHVSVEPDVHVMTPEGAKLIKNLPRQLLLKSMLKMSSLPTSMIVSARCPSCLSALYLDVHTTAVWSLNKDEFGFY